MSLLPCDPSSWLSDNHIAPILLDVVETFDLSAFRRQSTDGRGVFGFDPTMMVVLVLYCLLQKRCSARSMEHYIQCDLGGRYLCGNGSVPGWRCIADFRQKYRNQLATLFAQSVECCIEAKLVDTSDVFGDGSKLQAFASKQSNISYGKADKVLNILQKKFDALLEEADRLDADESKIEKANLLRKKAEKYQDTKQRILDAKQRMEERARLQKEDWDNTPKDKRPHTKAPDGSPGDDDRSNTVDPESRLMKFKDGSFKQAYNAQVVAEGRNQIILGATLSNDCTDVNQLQVTVEHVIETIDGKPKTWVADGGYLSEENIKYLDSRKIDAIICPNRRPDKEEVNKQHPSSGDANLLDGDVKNTNASSCEEYTKRGLKRQRAKPTQPKKPSWAQEQMKAKLATEEGKKIYSLRCQVIEPVFGQMKGSPGNPGMLSRFTVKGLSNCRDVLLLQCTAHNIGKLLRSKIAECITRQKPSLPTYMNRLPILKLRGQTLAMAI